MYDAIQNALTYASEAIAFITFIGLPAHSIIMSCINKSNSCGTPQVTPTPEVKIEVQPEIKPEAEEVAQPILVVEADEKPVKPRKSRKTTIPQPMSAGAAATDYSAMSSEQLRKQCTLQGINWRTGGNYAKPMKKAEMIAALQ